MQEEEAGASGFYMGGGSKRNRILIGPGPGYCQVSMCWQVLVGMTTKVPPGVTSLSDTGRRGGENLNERRQSLVIVTSIDTIFVLCLVAENEPESR